MDDDWDSENFEPKLELKVPLVVDKWKGEDEDDDVKESWEEEEEEKKDTEKAPVAEARPKKQRLEDKIAERERKRLEDLERKRKLLEDQDDDVELTPEEKLAEKLRRQKLQEEADLLLAKETFGITDNPGGIDGSNPSTKEEFSELASLINKKVQKYESNAIYVDFLEELVRNICVPLNANQVKKIKTTIDNMLLEKQKVEKEKSKKSKGGKQKARLKVEGKSDLQVYGDFDDFDVDDFM